MAGSVERRGREIGEYNEYQVLSRFHVESREDEAESPRSRSESVVNR